MEMLALLVTLLMCPPHIISQSLGIANKHNSRNNNNNSNNKKPIQFKKMFYFYKLIHFLCFFNNEEVNKFCVDLRDGFVFLFK